MVKIQKNVKTIQKNKKPLKKIKKKIKKIHLSKDTNLKPEDNLKAKESDEENVSGDEFEKHKKSLDKLKKTDPEFYKFLQENDKKLLEFNLLEQEDNDDDGDDGDDVDDNEEDEIHKPTDKLEVASDESDFEDGITEKKKVTLKLLKKWQADIHEDRTNKTINKLIQAFHGALQRVCPDEESDVNYYKVDSSAVFNGVIQLCVIELGPAIRQFLGLTSGTKQKPHKCKKFTKIKQPLKTYFINLTKLLSGVTSSNIQTVLLKHLHYMTSLLTSFSHETKTILKSLINVWGTADESVRVIAFFCILRITNNSNNNLDMVLRTMYLTYVKNSKFININNLAAINFMRRSLVEMFALDPNLSYQQIFIYIRQLAIHLRNAITMKKKEHFQAVYNWQFISSLKLWANLLSLHHNKQQLQPLIYPFVQVSLGTLKLIPTPQYYPLRFHVVDMLVEFVNDTNIFIPILPSILDILTDYDFNRKHLKNSVKPLQLTCLLRLSKSQLTESGFKDAVIDQIYGLLLKYLAYQSHTIGFPDLSLFCTLQMRIFLKKCSISKYNRKIKQLLDKIEENNKFIENERNNLTFNLTDTKLIDGWENQIKNKGTPLYKYFDSWYKVHTIKKNKELTNNDNIGDYKLPIIKKKNSIKQRINDDGPVELFPSDDSEEESNELDGKRKRGSRGGKKNKKFKNQSLPGRIGDGDAPAAAVNDIEGPTDIVEDFNLNDW